MPDNPLSPSVLKNLSEPITKLIESVSSAIGILYEPTRIRRKTKAEADASIILAKTNIRVKEIERRALQRINHTESRRQRNIDQIVKQSVRFLPDNVTKEPIEEDWITQFFEYCKDISDEEIQVIWSRLLAGEVARPGTYSPRTLHTLKHLRRKDAETFTRFCSFVMKINKNLFGRLRIPATQMLSSNEKLGAEELTQLDNLGLVKYNYFHLSVSDEGSLSADYLGKSVSVKFGKGSATSDAFRFLNIDCLTDVGVELYSICTPERNEKYFEAVLNWFELAGGIIHINE